MKSNKKAKYIYVVLISTSILLIYYFALLLLIKSESEGGNQAFNNIWDGIWYSIVTFTTVGYGDKFPITNTGKIIGSLFLFSSIFALSLIVSKTSEIVREIKEKKKMGVYGTKMQGHIIIIGWDSFAELIAEELVNAKQNIVIIVEDQQDIDLIYNKYDKKNVFVVFSDYRNHQFLKNCNVSESLMTFVNLPTDTDKLVFILNAKKYYPSMNFIISLNEGNLKETFKNAGVTYVLSKNEIASKLIASYIFESHVADFSADLLDSSKSDTDYDIQEFLINEMNPFKNLTFGEFSKRLKSDFNCIAIGLVKNGSSIVKKIPSDSEMIQVGDYVILISDGKSFSQVSKVFHQKQGNIV